MKPAMVADEMFPEGAGPYMDLEEAGGSSGLLMDLTANEKAVHADFFNDFDDFYDDEDLQLVASWRNSEPFSECTEPREGDAKIPTPTHHGKEFEGNIKVLHANVRSLRNKIDELEAFIADKQIDIICLTEHWMSESEISTTQLQGYRLAAFSARLQTTGGRTCIFIKDSISFSTINFGFNLNVEKCIEYCCVCLKDFNINILALYRSPSGPLDTFLASLDAVLNQLGTAKQVILADDTTVAFAADTLDEALEGSMAAREKIEEWFYANRLQLNRDKTKRTVFSLRDVGDLNNDASEVTFLGVFLDPGLQWNTHINIV
ncbi:hypothetical protein JTB14_012008 [Gonioctena quinquepunctata]|nr:hypothetical protein JTB14_012008 [Gonioctena quinquepunctata]